MSGTRNRGTFGHTDEVTEQFFAALCCSYLCRQAAIKKKQEQCSRSSREFRRAPPFRGKVGCDRSRARKAEGPMIDCRVAAEHRFGRPTPTMSCAARVRSP